jgi:Glycosyltransferase family 87
MPLEMELRRGAVLRLFSRFFTPQLLPIWVWLAVAVICCVRAYLSPPTRHSVYPNYSVAGRSWVQGKDTYGIQRDEKGAAIRHMSAYRYSPLVSALLVPFGLLPDDLGGVLWRLVNYICFLGAFAWFVREALPDAESWGEMGVAALWILLVPLSVSSMNNGQANVLLMALILAAGAAAVQQRWNLTSIFLAGACLLKIYPLAIALLMLVVFPRQLGWRFPLALGFGLVLPFAMQHPGYVLEQYENWLQILLVDNRMTFPMNEGYRDFYLLTRFVGVPMQPTAYLALQLSTAAGVAAICLMARLRRLPGPQLVQTVLALGCGWMTVFGPCTESCTFILIAPALAWALVDAFQPGRPSWSRWNLVLVLLMFQANMTVAWFPDGRNWLYGLQPLAALLFFLERLVTSVKAIISNPGFKLVF